MKPMEPMEPMEEDVCPTCGHPLEEELDDGALENLYIIGESDADDHSITNSLSQFADALRARVGK